MILHFEVDSDILPKPHISGKYVVSSIQSSYVLMECQIKSITVSDYFVLINAELALRKILHEICIQRLTWSGVQVESKRRKSTFN